METAHELESVHVCGEEWRGITKAGRVGLQVSE